LQYNISLHRKLQLLDPSAFGGVTWSIFDLFTQKILGKSVMSASLYQNEDIAIAYSMRQIIKSVCICLSACSSASTLTVVFLHYFHQNWHRRKNPEK